VKIKSGKPVLTD